MSLVDIFSEYLSLSHTPGIRSDKIKDIPISEYIIARKCFSGCKIIYLHNGSTVFIPWKWIDIFSSLNVHSGDRISYIRENIDTEDLGLIDKIILLFSRLVYFLDRGLSGISSEEFLTVLGDISSTGTKVFRDWCSENFEIKLDPLEYTSIDKSLEI